MGQAAVLLGPGTLLCERYEVDHLIAAGGMAEVYVATDRRLERPVALKVVRTVDIDVGRRLARESTILARLDHPNIVRVFDTDEHDGMPFIVMELVDGVSLAQQLVGGPLEPATVAAHATALADALVHAHELGIIHRDLKPSNVLVEPSGRPRLADFGIARATDATSVTATGVALGSAAYAAPEQLGNDPITPAADIYSLGLVLLECLTGRREFDGSPTEAALARLERDPVVPTDLDETWASMLTAMTRRAPEDRPTAAEVAALLPTSAPSLDATATIELTQPEEGGTAVMPRPIVDESVVDEPVVDQSVARRRRRTPLLVAAIVLAAAALLAALVLPNLGDDRDGGGPPPVADEGVVRTLDQLETAASVQPRFATRVANIRQAVFVSDAQTAVTQLGALGNAVDRQEDAGQISADEADAIRDAIIAVENELLTLPSG